MKVTLNITAKDIRLLAFDKGRVVYWEKKEILPGWVKDGHILEPKSVGAAIQAIFKSGHLYKTRVDVCLSGLPFIYRKIKLPPMKQGLIRDSIKHLMGKESSMPTDQMVFSWVNIEASENEDTLFVVGVDEQIVDAMVETMREAKIKHWAMDLQPIALARATAQRDCIIVLAEPEYYEITLVNDGIISTIHAVSMEEEIPNPIEQAKQLVAEIPKAISYDAKKHGRSLPDQELPVLITGELAGNEQLRDIVQNELGYTTVPLATVLETQADFPVYLFSTNIGLLLKDMGYPEVTPEMPGLYSDIRLDVLMGKYAQSPTVSLVKYSLVVMLIPVIIGVLVPVYRADATMDAETLRLQQALSAASRQLEEARAYDQEAKEIAEEVKGLDARLRNLQLTHEEMFGNQGDVVATLGQVLGPMPEDSYFKHLSVYPDHIDIQGYTDNASKVVGYTDALEQAGLPPEIHIIEIKKLASGDDESQSSSVDFGIIINR